LGGHQGRWLEEGDRIRGTPGTARDLQWQRLVVSDITGVTGLRILRDIVAGHRDPQQLAQHRDYRCRASEAEIVAALTGNYRAEQVFVLQQTGS
jgi:hypothetical protein